MNAIVSALPSFLRAKFRSHARIIGPRNGERGALLVIVGLAKGDDNVERIGSAAQKEADQHIPLRLCHFGRERKARHPGREHRKCEARKSGLEKCSS